MTSAPNPERPRRRRRAGPSERARVAMARLWFAGYDLRAIAVATGVSERAVKRRLRAAGVVVV